MVVVYIEFFIDTGLSEGCMGLRGAGVKSLGEGPVVQVGVYHVFCCRILRGRKCE